MADPITAADVQAFLGELGYPSRALLDPILCVVNKIIPCLDGAGYDDCSKAHPDVCRCAHGDVFRCPPNQIAGGAVWASRSFDYGDDGITWLRDSLAKLDTSGCTSELPISAGNSVGLFMVVGGC
jgi:hypothetical protein